MVVPPTFRMASSPATPSYIVPLKMTPIDRDLWDFAVLSNSSSMDGIQSPRFGAFSSDTLIVFAFTRTCRRGRET